MLKKDKQANITHVQKSNIFFSEFINYVNFEYDSCSDNYDIRISLYIINTLWLPRLHFSVSSGVSLPPLKLNLVTSEANISEKTKPWGETGFQPVNQGSIGWVD
jgi:hypothetical protein